MNSFTWSLGLYHLCFRSYSYMKRVAVQIFLVLSGLLLLTLVKGSRVQAASITLSGGCSIDNAILSANNNADVDIATQNVLVANNLANSVAANCFAMGMGAGGTESATITSLGHNISDDTSCGFTNTGDQESVSNILPTLGPLQDNGGSVPTIAILAGITSDQRGVARPQCAAFDVGAYEYDSTCPVQLVYNLTLGIMVRRSQYLALLVLTRIYLVDWQFPQ